MLCPGERPEFPTGYSGVKQIVDFSRSQPHVRKLPQGVKELTAEGGMGAGGREGVKVVSGRMSVKAAVRLAPDASVKVAVCAWFVWTAA